MIKINSDIESKRITDAQFVREKESGMFLTLEIIIKGDNATTIGMSNDPTYKLTCRMARLPIVVHGVLFTYFKN